MATTATKKQPQGAERRGEQQGQFAPGSSRPLQQTGQTTRGAQLVSQRGRDGRKPGGLKNLNAEQLARRLGWFSIGIGLAEILAPRGIAKIAGVRGNHTGLIRLFGLREIASGIGIFAQGRRPTAAVWSRVAGDALDLAALGAAFTSSRSRKGRVAFATANVLAVTAVDVICAQQLSSESDGAVHAQAYIIIERSPEELYRLWRDFENLPRFMKHLESVRVTGDNRSHWVAKAPAGAIVEWDAEIIEDRPNEMIAWRSLEGADVDNTGSVRFEPATAGRGTVVRVEIYYSPPGGAIGAAVAKLFGEEPQQQVSEDLRRFKQVVETGEVVVSEGALPGTGKLGLHPGQPTAGETER